MLIRIDQQNFSKIVNVMEMIFFNQASYKISKIDRPKYVFEIILGRNQASGNGFFLLRNYLDP